MTTIVTALFFPLILPEATLAARGLPYCVGAEGCRLVPADSQGVATVGFPVDLDIKNPTAFNSALSDEVAVNQGIEGKPEFSNELVATVGSLQAEVQVDNRLDFTRTSVSALSLI